MKKVVGLMSNIGCGGAEVQSIILFNGLSRNGFRVKVIVLDTQRVQLAERLDKNIEVEYVHRKSYFDPSAILLVKKHILEYEPDALIMVDNYPILYGFIYKRIFRLKLNCLIILHNTIPPNMKRALQNRLIYGPSINRLDRVVFVCNKQKEYWVDKYNINTDKAHVILNGIEIEHFEQFYRKNNKYRCREQLGIPANATVIAINASLWAPKCHDHMIEAMALLRKEGLELYLLIIGDGPQRKVLEELAIERGLARNVQITGYVSDVRPYLMSADISALTSITETLSMAAIESMALGKALILSNTGGAPELVEEGINGYLYPPGNIQELANAIRKITEGKKFLSMGEKSRKKARSLFTHDKMIRQYIELLGGEERLPEAK